MRRKDGMEDIVISAPGRGKCPVCATKHDPADPHDPNSLFYQIGFWKRNRRFPSWADAMEHCSPMTKLVWMDKLKKRGIRVDMAVKQDTAEDGQDGQ